jgi:AcrR family transcriptional regulator
VGVEPQSRYSYFDSKHARYDVMFAQANNELLGWLEALPEPDDPLGGLRRRARDPRG